MAFQFRVLTHSPERLNVISTKLGPDVNTKYGMAEVGKAIKLGPDGNVILCADGDEIEGFIDSVDTATQDGFSFGGAAHPNAGFRVEALVSGTALVFGDLVVAAAQAAIGTKSLPVVKKGAPVNFKYRVLSKTGAVGSTVVLEKI